MAAVEPKPTAEPARDPRSAGSVWTAACAALSGRSLLRAALAAVEPVAIGDGTLTLALIGKSGRLIEREREAVERAISAAAGRPLRLRLDDRPRPAEDAASDEAGGSRLDAASVADHPLVRAAQEVFGAEIKRVIPRTSGD